MNLNQNSFTGSEFSLGKYLFLGFISVVLCSSFVMSVFTPLPLCVAFFTFGRQKGYLLGGIGVGLCLLLQFLMGSYLLISYSLYFIFSLCIVEIIYRNLHPVQGLVKLSLYLGGGMLFLIILFGFSLDGGYEGLIKKKINEVHLEIEENRENFLAIFQGADRDKVALLLDDREKMVKNAVDSLPMIPFLVLIGIFFCIWVNLLLILRAKTAYLHKVTYDFEVANLIDFKVPDSFIWPFIISLVSFFLSGEQGQLNALCKGVIFTFALFYFFQGFGIFVDLLNRLRIKGLLRSFLVVFTIYLFHWVLALVGLFDMWVNFKKIFKNKLDIERGDGK